MADPDGAAVRPLAITGLALCALTAGAVVQPAPRLVWNASASVPVGLYRVVPGRIPRRGELALAWPPATVRKVAHARGYLPSGVPLIKPVAAGAGETVCANADAIRASGGAGARRLAADASGRRLRAWQGCRRLGKDEFLLIAPAAGSFDGRYFGPSSTSDLIGTAWRIWPT